MKVNFQNNTIDGLYQMNDINFYRHNSPNYKFFLQSVRNLDGVVVPLELVNYDKSSAIICA